MAVAAADGAFRYNFGGCLSNGDSDNDRRPYHRNCKCPLHNKSREIHDFYNLPAKCKNLSYPIKRSWSEGCLTVAAARSCLSSPSASPSGQPVELGRTTTQLVSCLEREEGEVGASCNKNKVWF